MNVRRDFLRLTMCGCLAVILLCRHAGASDSEYTRLSLMGLESVPVVVESVSSDMAQFGLTRDILMSRVTEAFQEAGVAVVEWHENLEIPGNPYLYVNVNAFKSETYVYAISLEFRQDVLVVRNPALKVDGVTWSRRYIGTTPLIEDIHSHVKSLLGIFIHAFRSVNPGPAGP